MRFMRFPETIRQIFHSHEMYLNKSLNSFGYGNTMRVTSAKKRFPLLVQRKMR